MHNSYFDPKTVELRAFREQAEKRLRTTNLFPSEETVIHYHKHGESCTRTQDGKMEYLEHEVYSNDPKVMAMFSDTGAMSTDGSQ